MLSLTIKEREALLILFKEYTSFYNANSISKVLKISHVGAQKIFQRFKRENAVIDTKIGKSIVHKLNLSDQHVRSLITFLLEDEANNFKRWKEEFKELFQKDRIILMFGSAIKNYAQAHDIDLMVVIEQKDMKEVNAILKKKEEILPKEIHALKLTQHDLLENIKKKDKAMVDIVKNAIILYGQEKYVEVMANVTSF